MLGLFPGKAKFSLRTMVKVLGICTIIVLANIALLAWLWAVAVEHFTVPTEYDGPPHQRGHKPPFPGDSIDNLWWFVHVSSILQVCSSSSFQNTVGGIYFF